MSNSTSIVSRAPSFAKVDLETNPAVVSRTRAFSPPLLAGLLAGCLATLLGLALAPRLVTNLSSVLLRAVAYVLLVFVVTVTTVLVLSKFRPHPIHNDVRQRALHCIIAALWLPPLLRLATQRSWLAVVLWTLVIVELCRWMGSVPDSQRPVAQTEVFALLKRDSIRVFSGVIVGSLALEAAAIATLGPHAALAGFLFIAGTILIAARGVRMLRESPPSQSARTLRQIPTVLAVSILLTAFAWLPRALGEGGGGFSGDSVASWESFLTSLLARHFGGGGAVNAQEHNTANATTSALADLVFPGVILYPEVESPHTLVAPKLTAVLGERGAASSDPLIIPFYGVYWFWRPPGLDPPSTSVLRRGSPAAHTFRSNDGSPLWMEAKQNLAFAIDLRHCGAIDVIIDNADSIPRSVALELQLRDSALPGQPFESLGVKEVVATGEKPTKPVPQTLRFRVPAQTTIPRFDELTVRFRLQWWRGSQSANIAINRFRLIPRG